MAVTAITRTLQLFSCDFCGTVHGSEQEARAYGCLSGPPKQKFSIGQKVYITVHVDGRPPHNIACRVTSVRSPRAAGWVPDAHLPVARYCEGDRDHLAVALSSTPHTWIVGVDCEDDRVDDLILDGYPGYPQDEVSPRKESTNQFPPVSIRPSLLPTCSQRTVELIEAVSGRQFPSVTPAPRTETPTLPCAAL